jgi:hypothetical protein
MMFMCAGLWILRWTPESRDRLFNRNFYRTSWRNHVYR